MRSGARCSSATLVGYADDMDGNDCGAGTSWGDDQPDVVYSFTPTESAGYSFLLSPTTPSLLYVTTDCDDMATGCQGAHDFVEDSSAATFTLTADTTYFIVIDAYEALEVGPFTLTVDQVDSE